MYIDIFVRFHSGVRRTLSQLIYMYVSCIFVFEIIKLSTIQRRQEADKMVKSCEYLLWFKSSSSTSNALLT